MLYTIPRHNGPGMDEHRPDDYSTTQAMQMLLPLSPEQRVRAMAAAAESKRLGGSGALGGGQVVEEFFPPTGASQTQWQRHATHAMSVVTQCYGWRPELGLGERGV